MATWIPLMSPDSDRARPGRDEPFILAWVRAPISVGALTALTEAFPEALIGASIRSPDGSTPATLDKVRRGELTERDDVDRRRRRRLAGLDAPEAADAS